MRYPWGFCFLCLLAIFLFIPIISERSDPSLSQVSVDSDLPDELPVSWTTYFKDENGLYGPNNYSLVNVTDNLYSLGKHDNKTQIFESLTKSSSFKVFRVFYRFSNIYLSGNLTSVIRVKSDTSSGFFPKINASSSIWNHQKDRWDNDTITFSTLDVGEIWYTLIFDSVSISGNHGDESILVKIEVTFLEWAGEGVSECWLAVDALVLEDRTISFLVNEQIENAGNGFFNVFLEIPIFEYGTNISFSIPVERVFNYIDPNFYEFYLVNSSLFVVLIQPSFIRVYFSPQFWADGLAWVTILLDFTENYVFLLTNWGNTTIYIYDNQTLLGVESEGHIDVSFQETLGVHFIDLVAVSGDYLIFANLSYCMSQDIYPEVTTKITTVVKPRKVSLDPFISGASFLLALVSFLGSGVFYFRIRRKKSSQISSRIDSLFRSRIRAEENRLAEEMRVSIESLMEDQIMRRLQEGDENNEDE